MPHRGPDDADPKRVGEQRIPKGKLSFCTLCFFCLSMIVVGRKGSPFRHILLGVRGMVCLRLEVPLSSFLLKCTLRVRVFSPNA